MRRTMRSRFSTSLLLSDLGNVLILPAATPHQWPLGTIEWMRNSQGTTLLFLAVALVLFFFSLSLLPAVELYCRFRKPAAVLLILEVVLMLLWSRWRKRSASDALTVATFVFAALGIVFNAVLLIKVAGKC